MRIDHIAMYVQDLEKTKQFFMDYFGAVSNGGYHNPITGLKTYFLTFEDGARLEIMNHPDQNASKKELKQVGYIHLAFSVGSVEKVNELTRKLTEGGYEVISGPRTTGDGYYESCVLDLEGNQIEITV